MSPVDVSAQPLGLKFVLWLKQQNQLAASNADYKSSSFELSQVEPFLSANVKAQLQAVQPLLAAPIGELLDTEWRQVEQTQKQRIAQLIISGAAKVGHPINSVTVTFPSTGAVLATIEPAHPASGPDPARPPTLVLDYRLGKSTVKFEWGSLTSWWLDTFDIDVVLSTPVPQQPFGFDPSVVAVGSDASFSSDGGWAGFQKDLDNLFTDLGNFLTGGSYESSYFEAKDAVVMETDESVSLGGSSKLAAVLSGLNSVGPEVVAQGFTQCAFSISDQQLTFTITHPLDPGPVIEDAENPPGTLTDPPELSASQKQLARGQHFTADGQHFPLASTTQLKVRWASSSSGPPEDTQLAISGFGVSKTEDLAYANGWYAYTADGLSSGASYSFSARCSDANTWSLWSADPLSLSTAETDMVELLLVAPPGSTQDPSLCGEQPLSVASSDWSCAAQVQPDIPLGEYTLVAQRGGETLAIVERVLITADVEANLAVLDAKGQVEIDPQTMGGQQFTIRGEGFPDGPVGLTMDGSPAGDATSSHGTFTVHLTAPDRTGYLTITAKGDSGVEQSIVIAEPPAPK